MGDQAKPIIALEDIFQVARWQDTLPWSHFREGIEIHRFYGDGVNGPTAALLRFQPGARVAMHEHVGYEHVIVLSGSQVDENGSAKAGTLVINPPMTRHSVQSTNGCIVLVIYEKPVAFVDSPSAHPA